jgi:hypothetical protein
VYLPGTDTERRRWRRRQLLQTVGRGAAGVALGSTLSLDTIRASAASPATPASGAPVYRLSTRNNRGACAACKAHAANRYYQTADAADAGRAHPGCSCHILSHDVDRAQYDTWFADASRPVHDARWGRAAGG